MQALKNLFHWLVVSSANPNDAALTVKGLLTMIVPVLLPIGMILHLTVDTDQIALLVQAVVAVVQASLVFIGAILTVIGIARKLSLTLAGRNQVATELAAQ